MPRERELSFFDLFNMTSVDSGVETGNDSNDSSSVQHENQHVAAGQVTSSNITAISPVNKEMRIDQYDNWSQIRMKCPRILTSLTHPRLCFDSDSFRSSTMYKQISEDNTLSQNDVRLVSKTDKFKVNRSFVNVICKMTFFDYYQKNYFFI